MAKKKVADVLVQSPYGVDQATLYELNTNKDTKAIEKLGGVEGLAKTLSSDVVRGLDDTASGEASLLTHQQVFGVNVLPQAPPKSFFGICWENCKDPIIILLIFAATVSLALGAGIKSQREERGWLEGVAIWGAVFIVIGVGAMNDYQKDLQFRKLNAQKDIINVKVIRGHQQILVPNTEVVVGDVMLIDTGDKLVADGLLIDSQGLVIDEASLTGESEPIKKSRDGDPWCRSGTQVTEGSGKMLIVAVGINSEWGKTFALMQDADDSDTPLQERLEWVAMTVGKVGFAVAVACFLALLIKWCVDNKGFPISKINGYNGKDGPVQFFLFAITIIVVAVPEGLPLAVTISLAYSMKKMMKDNNFVRVLAACETMGGATAICSDKTGTLTQNRMTVVEGWFSGKILDHAPEASELQPDLLEQLKLNIAVNSKAFLILQPNESVEFVGNRTECALLMLLRKLGHDYAQIREDYEQTGKIVRLWGFSSKRKMASVLVKHDDRTHRLYNKGAAEWVLQASNRAFNEYGDIVPITDELRAALMAAVVGMASRGLRCICLAYTDVPSDVSEELLEDSANFDKDLIVMAIVGIKDPIRPEVPDAVATCQRAGIVVRMVTGDNIHTAKHIAEECGILTSEYEAMEGPDFRVLTSDELSVVLPKLRVLARSSPEDKLILVRELKKLREVVAVTGDGTNDAPALKESDVGLAMGIAGTEVAKEAADIVILDDNFSSIVKSVLWGRSVFANIRKFLMFQLTVNTVGLIIVFVGCVAGGHEALNVLQLLWVNLIMDTLGALALATEDPNPELLLAKPHGHSESLITPVMWKHIFTQAAYQLVWLFLCLYGLPQFFDRYAIVSESEYFTYDNCMEQLKSDWDPFQSVNATNSTLIQTACSIFSECGWPSGDRASSDCILQPYYAPKLNNTGKVPSSMNQAICGYYTGNLTTSECWEQHPINDMQETMYKDFEKQQEEDRMDSLSLLFNVFIWCQAGNEINARRINDELTIFENILRSPIFMSVLLVTAVLQVLIMETKINILFKVHGLDGYEWLASIVVGLGCIPFSIGVRLLSRLDWTFNPRNPGGKGGKNKHMTRRSSSRVHSILGSTDANAAQK